MDTSNLLTVLISCPLLLEDNLLRCTLDKNSTIEALKTSLATRLDCRPKVSEQRLIFGGRILEDGETLERVFEKIDYTEGPPTLHLVVSQQHSCSLSFAHSAPASPSPLRFRKNTTVNNSQSHTSTTMSSSSAPNAADIRASTAPPPSTSLGNDTTFSTTSATSTAANHHKALDAEAATALPPPYTYTPNLPWANTIYQSAVLQPYQYVIVNGMPYLMPTGQLPLLQQQALFGYPIVPYDSMMVRNSDGSVTFVSTSSMTVDQLRAVADTTQGGAAAGVTAGAAAAARPPAGAGAGVGGVAALGAAEGNLQEAAARDQRRAASFWLLMKLAFGVYLFGQNGSFERKVLLHITALIIFLHQTGRLRIVRRIAPAQPDGQGNLDVNRPQDGIAQPEQNGHAAGEAGSSGTSRPAAPDTSSNNDSPSTLESSSSASLASSASNYVNEKAGGEGSSTSTVSSNHVGGLSSSALSGNGGDGSSQQQQQQHQTNTNTQDQQQPLAGAAAPLAQERVSVWRSIEHALLTFVTSLVPAPQPEIDPAVANAAAAGERM